MADLRNHIRTYIHKEESLSINKNIFERKNWFQTLNIKENTKEITNICDIGFDINQSNTEIAKQRSEALLEKCRSKYCF